jgi:hypothetical protein
MASPLPTNLVSATDLRLAKAKVAGSNPVFRSNRSKAPGSLRFRGLLFFDTAMSIPPALFVAKMRMTNLRDCIC